MYNVVYEMSNAAKREMFVSCGNEKIWQLESKIGKLIVAVNVYSHRGIECEREDMNNSTFTINIIQRSSCFISDKLWSSVGLKANQEI